MPCSDSNWETIKDSSESLLKERCNHLTNLLCKVGRALENNNSMPDDVLQFWKAHKQFDEARGEPWNK